MRKKLLTFLIVFLIIITGFFLYQKNNSEPPIIVTLTNDGFNPNTVKIKKGTTVEFRNETGQPFWPASDLHPTHGIYPEFDPQEPVPENSSWSFQFNKIGSWKYHDHLSPYFRGVVNVE